MIIFQGHRGRGSKQPFFQGLLVIQCVKKLFESMDANFENKSVDYFSVSMS